MTTYTAVKTSEWVERVRALAPVVEQWRDAGEQERHMPRPLFEALRDAGVFRMSAAKAVGGAEVEEETVLQAIEELARQDGSVGWNVMIASDAAIIASYLPVATLREVYRGGPNTVIAGALLAKRRGHAGAGRLPPDGALDVCERLSSGGLDAGEQRRHGAWDASPPPGRQAGRQDLLRTRWCVRDPRYLAHGRLARYRQSRLAGDRRFRPRGAVVPGPLRRPERARAASPSEISPSTPGLASLRSRSASRAMRSTPSRHWP